MALNQTILEVTRHIRNYFTHDRNDKPYLRKDGVFDIADGNIALDGDFAAGDWIAISESRRHNGIYRLDKVPPLESPLEPYTVPHFRLANGTDDVNPLDGVESLTGAVNLLVFPAGFTELCKEINTWINDEANAPSAVISESEGVLGVDNWSVKRAVGADGKPLSWEALFSGKLSLFRSKMFTAFKI